MPRKSSVRAQKLTTRPANAFGLYDSVPFALVDINRVSKEELIQHLGVTAKVAERIVAARDSAPISSLQSLQSIRGLSPRVLERIRGRIIFAGDPGLHILDITARDE